MLRIELREIQNSDEMSLLIMVFCILIEALRGLAFCIVQKLMPEFALSNIPKRSSGNEGSNKMYRVAQNAPQGHFVTFSSRVLLCLAISGELKIVKP